MTWFCVVPSYDLVTCNLPDESSSTRSSMYAAELLGLFMYVVLPSLSMLYVPRTPPRGTMR